MVIETINNQRVLTPDENMWLYNESQRVISDKVYLGVEADASDWVEITQEQKELLESQWESEAEGIPNTNISEETLMKAQAYDIITGGVK